MRHARLVFLSLLVLTAVGSHALHLPVAAVDEARAGRADGVANLAHDHQPGVAVAANSLSPIDLSATREAASAAVECVLEVAVTGVRAVPLAAWLVLAVLVLAAVTPVARRSPGALAPPNARPPTSRQRQALLQVFQR